MPSSPERGPIRMSAPSCSTNRRVSSIALLAVESEQPKPTMLTSLPAIFSPVIPSLGFAQVVDVERPAVALAVRQDADLDRARRRGCVVVAVARGQRQQREHGKGGEQPPGDGSVLTSKQISLLWKMHSSSNRSV